MSSAQHALEVLDVPDHCGNAPRKLVLRDVLIAMYQRDTAHLSGWLREDVHWEIIGSVELHGLTDVVSWWETQPEARGLHVATIMTHGTDCAADGTVTLYDGAGLAFSHVFHFTGHAKTAKIKTIRSYLIPL